MWIPQMLSLFIKRNPKSYIDNNKALTILWNICKIYERYTYDQIQTYFETMDIGKAIMRNIV